MHIRYTKLKYCPSHKQYFEEYLPEKEAAKFLRINQSYLVHLRNTKSGPFFLLNKDEQALYKREDLVKFLKKRKTRRRENLP